MSEYQTVYTRSHALVVGIDEYNDDELDDLENAVRGANTAADLLRNIYGFETELLLNEHASQENIFNWFTSINASSDDRVLIYFAGHGITRKTANREIGYFALSSTQLGEYVTALKMDALLDEADLLNAKHVLVLLDACFSGLALTQRRTASRKDLLSDVQKLADNLMSRTVRYVITAGGAEAVDDNGSPEGDHSIFTHHLIEVLNAGLPTTSSLFRARQLANYLEEQVAINRRSNHKPNHGYFGQGGEGDFIFQVPEDLLPIDGFHSCKVEYDTGVQGENSHFTGVLQKFRRTASLRILENITSGQSGSGVFLVDATGRHPHDITGLYYCKIYKTPTGQEAETHKSVYNTTIGEHIPRLVDTTPVINGWMASLYAVAHQTTLRGSQPLSKLIDFNMSGAKVGAEGLITILKTWNPLPVDRENSHPQQLMQRMLHKFMLGSDTANEDLYIRIESFFRDLTPEVLGLLFSKAVLPNPIAFLYNSELWKLPRTILWPKGHMHGDLHSNNVICPLVSNGDFRGNVDSPIIIDFDTYESGNCIFFDLAYLEIDLAMRMLNPANDTNRILWLEISSYLTLSVGLSDYPPLPPVYYPLHTLIGKIRCLVKSICDQYPGDFDAAFWLARACAGLSFVRKRKVNNSQRLLALLIAAHSLEKALVELEVQFTPVGQPYWIDWVASDSDKNQTAYSS